MSASNHPIAIRLARFVDGETSLLAVVMGLPLVDGIFVALVVAGALTTMAGIIETGLLIFGGSATMAVILTEMDRSRRELILSIGLIGAIIIPVAAVQAAIAPTIESLLNLGLFQYFAGLVILAVAAKTVSAQFGEYLPSPGIIVGLGLIVSLDPNGLGFHIADDLSIVLAGAAAAAVGVAFALGVALSAPKLRDHVDIDRFRFGSAVALGVLALPFMGVLDTEAPIALAVLAVTALLAYDPARKPAVDSTGNGSSEPHDPDLGVIQPAVIERTVERFASSRPAKESRESMSADVADEGIDSTIPSHMNPRGPSSGRTRTDNSPATDTSVQEEGATESGIDDSSCYQQ